MFSGRRTFPAAKATVAGAIGMGAGILSIGSAAMAAEPSQQEMLDKIKSLEAKVEQLENRQDQRESVSPSAQTQPSEPGSGGGNASIDSVLNDAERRSNPSFLQAGGGFTAGFNHNRFVIQDEAGNFSLRPDFQLQARYVANYRRDDTANGTGDRRIESGFEISRMKFAFEGNVFGPDLVYRFQWATYASDTSPRLEDAWVRYSLRGLLGDAGRNWAVRAGQFKDPTFHEENVNSRRQLAVDRSMANEVLGGGVTDWVQGVSVIWDDGPGGSPFRAEFGFTDGINTDNTNFVDAGGSATFGADHPAWGAFGRVEYLAMGDWRQYEDFTAMGNTNDLLVIGGGLSYTQSGRTAGGADTLFYTADVQYESGKLGLYGAFYGAYGEPATASAGGTNDYAVLAQAGYMLNDKWEVFGRFDELFLDSARIGSSSEDKFPEVTIGLNWYLKGHAAKFTIDGTWLPNGTPQDLSQLGILDPDGDKAQFIFRTQFQLLI
jgi:hypothetical protein